MAYEDGDPQRNLFALVVRMQRVEDRLVAQDSREEDRQALLKALIRDAVREGLDPVQHRLDALERDVAAAKTTAKAWVLAGGLLTTVAGAIAWAFDHIPGVKP